MPSSAEKQRSDANLSTDELRRLDAYWRACNYLSVGMLYLRDNPLLREPLKPEHLKNRLLGHWGSDPGQSLVWVHLNRLIKKYDLDVIYLSGPGHGAPATLANSYLEGVYSEVYPDRSQDAEGLQRFFKLFSFPGGIGSHCTPETPGSIHEGGELGYCLSHAYGAAFDNPGLIAVAVIGDGESETGPLATSWHSNKFLNPVRDGAVLPVLHLNGYKIANPTILARIPADELESLLNGYGYKPYVVEGDEPAAVHQLMATTLERCILEIREIQELARKGTAANATRPRWPMIVMRTPKGWTCPKEVDGKRLEGFWRAHQVPITDPVTNPAHLKLLEGWMRSYHPEELFDARRPASCRTERISSRGYAPDQRKPARQRWIVTQTAQAPGLPRVCGQSYTPGPFGSEQHARTRSVPARCDAQQHDELQGLRSGRNRFQQTRGDIRSEQKDVARRAQARGS